MPGAAAEAQGPPRAYCRIDVVRSHLYATTTQAVASDYPSIAHRRIHGQKPSFTVPISFFDYDAWDKVTKPANFNMKIPAELCEEAKKRQTAAALRVNVDTPIYDGRPVQDSISLDRTGFRFDQFCTSMAGQDFYDIQTVHEKYFPECISIVKSLTGATKVLPFDHSVRNKLLMGQNGISGYALGAHNDNTVDSGPKRVRQLLKDNAHVEEVMSYRYAVMNVWRRWDGSNDYPLAVCSGDSLAPLVGGPRDYRRLIGSGALGKSEDLIGSDLIYRNRTGETYSARSNQNQTWFWFPNMTIDEAIVLKIYDSAYTGETATQEARPTAGWTLHSAFDHPTESLKHGTASGPRESCEVRCLVLWAPEDVVQHAELKGVTGLSGGDQFYDAKLGKYVDAAGDVSSVMREETYEGSHDYSKFRAAGKE